jgi:hypothetical protein
VVHGVVGVEELIGDGEVHIGRAVLDADDLDVIHGAREVEVQVSVGVSEEHVGRGPVFVPVVGLGEEPRRRLGLVAPVVVGNRRGGGERLGRVRQRAVEGRDGEPLVLAEWMSASQEAQSAAASARQVTHAGACSQTSQSQTRACRDPGPCARASHPAQRNAASARQ